MNESEIEAADAPSGEAGEGAVAVAGGVVRGGAGGEPERAVGGEGREELGGGVFGGEGEHGGELGVLLPDLPEQAGHPAQPVHQSLQVHRVDEVHPHQVPAEVGAEPHQAEGTQQDQALLLDGANLRAVQDPVQKYEVLGMTA